MALSIYTMKEITLRIYDPLEYKEANNLSYSELAKALGEKDRSNVYRAVSKGCKLVSREDGRVFLIPDSYEVIFSGG